MTKQLDDALGLNPLMSIQDDEPTPNLPAVIQHNENQADNDVNFARENLYDAAVKAQSAIEDMIAIAQQSQHPKAYEVLNSMIKTYADVSMGMADLQLKKQRLAGKAPVQEQQKTINNNLFVGSTAELQKMLDDLKNKDD